MICSALNRIGISERALRHGASMDELKSMSSLDRFELDLLREGKDRSIVHMLTGRNGFAPNWYETPQARAAFDSGCVIERSDLRSMQAWARDFDQAMEDRRRGRVS